MACEVSVMPKRDAEKDLQAAKTTTFLTIREMFNLVRQGIPFWINEAKSWVDEAKNWRDIAKGYEEVANAYCEKLHECNEDIAKLKADLQCMAGKYGREKQMREAAEARAEKAERVQERFDEVDRQIKKLKNTVFSHNADENDRHQELLRLILSAALLSQQERSDLQDTLLLEIWKAAENGYRTVDVQATKRLAEIFTAAAMAAKEGRNGLPL